MFCALAAILFVGSAATSEAQGRRGHGRAVVVVGGGYYAPYYDPYFYADPWYGYQYPYPMRPYGYGYRNYEPEASVRLEVKPKEAEVYVDGYYAGIVDDFDGTFQRLRVEPGEHEIELWLDGYRTVKQKVYLTQDNTFRVKYQMERLASGQAPEPKPQPIDPPQGGSQPRTPQPPMQQPMGRGPTLQARPCDSRSRTAASGTDTGSRTTGHRRTGRRTASRTRRRPPRRALRRDRGLEPEPRW